MKKLITISLLFFILFSCRKDEENIVSDNPREYTPELIQEEYGQARVVGFVTDKTGEPLAGVRVFYGEHESMTDGDGSFELTEVSAGNDKRIWFQKDGYALNQKLVDVREDLPNRVDAALFPIAKQEKLTDEGGLIEGDDFSVEIQPGGFVYSDGEIVEGEVTVSATPFFTSEEEFFGAFPGNFEGTRENGSITPIESLGFIDVDLRDENGEPVQLSEGVTATIKIKAPENAPATIPMWYYDYNKAEWVEEGTGNLDNSFYTTEVNHFTPWNWDLPIELQSTIIGRVVDNEGNPIEGASVSQKGLNRNIFLDTKSSFDGTFEMITTESLELELEAQFHIYSSTVLEKITSSNQGEVNDFGDILIEISKDNIVPPYILVDTLYIVIGDTAKIRGKYFGINKKQDYKLLINGNEVETTIWENDHIEFIVPDGIDGEGLIQIDRDGKLSQLVVYVEGDRSCEINWDIYYNYDLPLNVEGQRFLDLSNIELKEIPSCIGNLHNLERLWIQENQLTSLPKSIGNLEKLEFLYIPYNQITSLPTSFGFLKNLYYCYISLNQLISLPESIGNLQNLNELFVGQNQLTSLPESIGNLSNLERLNLSFNQLSSLPASIGNLDNLEILDLYDNQLKSLPESIKNLSNKLTYLTLRGNPISDEEKAKIEAWLPNTEIIW